MRLGLRLLICVIGVISGSDVIAQSAFAQSAFEIKTIDPETFRAMAFKLADGQQPSIDGKLTDEAWALAPVQGNFVKRDAGLNKGDQIKITIDTFHDHRNAFYFSTNPLGAYKDANTVENGRTINYDWNAVWDNKTSVDDKGWYIEIAIPLSQLRFRTAIGESMWGINLCRILFRKNEESYWVPFLLPTASRDYVSRTEGEADAKYGGDFKVGLTNDLIADFTYHTDFAQVEADQEVVNLTRFSLFFPEKRQFFTEGAGIFDRPY